ncbi:MAG: ATP-binding protein [Candidatus Rokubacteria bacterium]|nr:ATP-binding protein [Candidatus Rokubacteria bacterium]
MNLRLRLFLVLIVPLVLMVGAFGLVRTGVEIDALARVEQENARVSARAVNIALENALRDRKSGDVARLIDELATRQDKIGRIRIFDASGTPFVLSEDVEDAPIPAEQIARVIATGKPLILTEEGRYPRRFVYLSPLRLPPATEADSEAMGAMEILFVTHDADARLWSAFYHVFVPLGALTLLLALLTGVVLQRVVLRPLAGLTRSIRQLGEGQPGPPLPVARRDELGVVAEEFNRMSEQLEAARQHIESENERTRELERQLRQSETLAVAGKLTSGIAHEVGTPLNIISGRAEIMLRALPGDHPGRPDLEVIVAQIDRISGIIRSLLDTVRLQKPSIHRVEVPGVLERLLPLLDHVARRRGIVIETQLPPALPDIAADPSQLQQVLINLLMNALQATPRGGRITVEGRVHAHDGRRGLAITVTDTGSGIRAEVLPRIFEPFYTTKPPGEGTGLGLAICRDIVREHGGTLAAHSRDGRGSTFTMWLPQYEAAA